MVGCKVVKRQSMVIEHMIFSILRRCSSYTQGQIRNKTREYFYYVDHNGQLFLDDARMKNFTSCFKDIKFLALFFKRLKPNKTSWYPEFSYIYICASELNFIKSDDVPYVFTSFVDKSHNQNDDTDILCLNYTKDQITFPFQPQDIYINPLSGRVYHPAPENGGGVGLVKSTLAQTLSPYFLFSDLNGQHILKEKNKYDDHIPNIEVPPYGFKWKGKEYKFTNKLKPIVQMQSRYIV